MEARATTRMAAITVFASTAGWETTAVRTSTTVPARLAIKGPPATTAWPHSSASVLTVAQVMTGVKFCRHTVKMDFDGMSKCGAFLCPQVCCATLMMPASATHVKRVLTVTPTQLTAKQSAHVHQVILDQPATQILMSVPLVSTVTASYDIFFITCCHMERLKPEYKTS